MGTIGRFICPNCNATNVQSGNCFKCGADLLVTEVNQQSDNDQSEYSPSSQQSASSGSLRSLQSTPQFSKQQLVLLTAGALLLLALFLMFGGHSPSPQPSQTLSTISAEKSTAPDKAIALATRYAGFKDAPPPNWKYEDTSEISGEMPSFALRSQLANQNDLFIVWDNQTVVSDLHLLDTKLPFTDLVNEKPEPFDKGEGIVGSGPFKWQVAQYTHSKDSQKVTALLGAFKSPVAGKAIVVIAQPYEEAKGDNSQESPSEHSASVFDYKTSLWLVDTMAANFTTAAKENNQTDSGKLENQANKQEETTNKSIATEAQLKEYCKQVETRINQRFKPAKEKVSKPTIAIVSLTEEGTISKLEIVKSSGEDDLDQLLIKAITNGQPYSSVPHTNNNGISLRTTADKGKLTVELE